MASYYSAPKAGDIVQCRFPQDKLRQPGPKDRPALVIEVEEYELPWKGVGFESWSRMRVLTAIENDSNPTPFLSGKPD